jgi:hypothetical protein
MADVNYIPMSAPEIGWKADGALGGWGWAERDINHQNAVDNQMALADLAMRKKLMEQMEWEKQGETRRLEDLAKRGGFQSDVDLQQSGLWHEAARAGKQGDILKSQEKAYDFTQKMDNGAKLKKLEQAHMFSQMMGDYTPESMTKAAQLYQNMTGQPVPPELLQIPAGEWKQASASIRNSIEHLRKLEVESEKGAMDFDRATEVARIGAEASRYGADRRAKDEADWRKENERMKRLEGLIGKTQKEAAQAETMAWPLRQIPPEKLKPEQRELIRRADELHKDLQDYKRQYEEGVGIKLGGTSGPAPSQSSSGKINQGTSKSGNTYTITPK